MITKEELQTPRTVEELSIYLDELFAEIREDQAARQAARAGKGLYKPLMEELWPISWYFTRKYAGSFFRLKLELGNQGFDAVVLDEHACPVEWVEVSWPMDGHKHAGIVRLLNERGRGPIEVYDNPIEKLREVFEFTIAGAQKKAIRDYNFKRPSTLALVVDLLPYYRADVPEHHRAVMQLIKRLSQLEYRVSKVVLLLAHSQEVFDVRSSR
ncbi:MAG: hypothetical protein ACOZBW_08565 [Thermodesulfobacteriota bacterium]